jgi:hypothetical protein
MKTVFVTRIKNKKDFKDDNLKKLIRVVSSNSTGSIKDNIYIISDFENPNYKINTIPVHVVQDDDSDPTSPISFNRVLKIIKKSKEKPDAFLVCSKEVGLDKEHLETLIDNIRKNLKHLLVVGYKFKIVDEKLNNELQGYYNNKNLIAYQVPWNTCAIWNYKLFNDYINKFDEITFGREPFNFTDVSIDGVPYRTEHKGMEDGLAIAQASSQQKKPKIYFKLLDENPLSWAVDSDKIKHRKKLARKEAVLRNFMAFRNYSVKDLLDAKK